MSHRRPARRGSLRTRVTDRRRGCAVSRRRRAREGTVYAVSRVERYLECPFKYFAGQVLQLEEEREDESGLTALERGQLLHGVFEAFFEAWSARGRSGVTADDLDEALALFEEVAEAAAAGLARGRPRARAHLSARLGRRTGTRRAGVCRRDRAGHRRDGAAARVRVRRHVRASKGSRGARASGAGQGDRIDLLDGRHAAGRGLQARARAEAGARAAAADLRDLAAQQISQAQRGTRCRLPAPATSPSRRRTRSSISPASPAMSRPRCAMASSDSSTRSPASRRRIPAEPDEPWTLHPLRIPACLPEGLRR